MKNIICLLLVAAISLQASAKKTKANRQISYLSQSELTAYFGSVEKVFWTETSAGLMRADFIDEEGEITAFFHRDGEFIASTRYVTKSDLPKNLQKDLTTRFSDANVLTIFELESDLEHSWYIEMIVNNKRILYKGFSFGRLLNAPI